MLAMPKTGTTALVGALGPHASIAYRRPPHLKHTHYRRYERIFKPFFEATNAPEGMETFALIRNPIDWLGSWYRYRSRDSLEGHQNSTKGISFDTFITEYISEEPAPFADVGRQSNFLMNTAGEVGVDHLYQYEETETYLRFLMQRLNTEILTRQRNVSPKMELKLSPDVKAALLKDQALDFHLWEFAQG